MTAIQGISVPKPHAPHATAAGKDDGGLKPSSIALGGLAAASLTVGGIAGAIKGSPLKGLAIGGAVAAAALGAALIGNASSSQRDGYCDYYGDPDCDYPGTGSGYDDGYGRGYDPGYRSPGWDNPYWDGGYRDSDGDGAREDYPDTGYYPGGGTSYGDGY